MKTGVKCKAADQPAVWPRTRQIIDSSESDKENKSPDDDEDGSKTEAVNDADNDDEDTFSVNAVAHSLSV